MSTRTLQYALCCLKTLLTGTVALAITACHSGTMISPVLTGGLWNNSYMATGSGVPPKTVTAKQDKTAAPSAKQQTSTTAIKKQTVTPATASSNCSLKRVIYEASAWENRLPPIEYGQNSLDFIKGIYNKSCQPLLQAVRANNINTALPKGLNPASIVVFGQNDKRVAALVQECNTEGTCEALLRLPDKVYAIKFNIKDPHHYRNNRGEVINTMLQLPGSKLVATSGELLLEAHQAYGKYNNNSPSTAKVALGEE